MGRSAFCAPRSRPLRMAAPRTPLTGGSSPRDRAAPHDDRPHQVRRPRPVRRAAARAHPPGRLGLPDHRGGPDPRPSGAPRPAGGSNMPGAGAGLAPHRRIEMTTTLLGIVDDRALGTNMRLIVTRPDRLAAAKAAADRAIAVIDEAASRSRDDSERSRIHREPRRSNNLPPLTASAPT